MAEVDDLRLRSPCGKDSLHNPYIFILQSEIGGQGDDGRHGFHTFIVFGKDAEKGFRQAGCG
jgi:hypothetical protein